jgi:chromosome segregation ATPase
MECIELSMKNKAKRESKALTNINGTESSATTSDKTAEYEVQIANLEAENRVLLAQISAIAASKSTSTTTNANGVEEKLESLTITATVSESSSSTELSEMRQRVETSEKTVESLREQVRDLGSKLTEMTGLYESAKQAELDEKNKYKHLDRSMRAMKIEKDQLNAQLADLQERSSLQARDLLEAQQQRKLAVMEFTDVNEKVNELRSKNHKLSSDMLAREDEIDELKRQLTESKGELDKRDRLIEELRLKVDAYIDKISKQESESREQVAAERDTELVNEVTLFYLKITKNLYIDFILMIK